MIKQNIKNIH